LVFTKTNNTITKSAATQRESKSAQVNGPLVAVSLEFAFIEIQQTHWSPLLM